MIFSPNIKILILKIIQRRGDYGELMEIMEKISPLKKFLTIGGWKICASQLHNDLHISVHNKIHMLKIH